MRSAIFRGLGSPLLRFLCPRQVCGSAANPRLEIGLHQIGEYAIVDVSSFDCPPELLPIGSQLYAVASCLISGLMEFLSEMRHLRVCCIVLSPLGSMRFYVAIFVLSSSIWRGARSARPWMGQIRVSAGSGITAHDRRGACTKAARAPF
jgi:hypothetical protein